MIKRLAGFLLTAATTVGVVGCGPRHASFVKVDDVRLGRVVIYRNGVAFYERRAQVHDGVLTVSVPRDRVDDFLKSLTVVDAVTNQPLPISIPRRETVDGTNLSMQLQLPGKDNADVVLTYVTESPAWKPSYRVVVGEHRDVMLEGWAIVDNTSGEDWDHVRVGVGSSSALSFHYDLWSVRDVQRETLANEARFAIAPPTGISPYGASPASSERQEVVLEGGTAISGSQASGNLAAATPPLSDQELAKLAEQEAKEEVITVTGSSIERSDYADYRTHDRYPAKQAPPAVTAPPAPTLRTTDPRIEKLAAATQRTGQHITIEVNAANGEAANQQRATLRGNAVRDQLVDQGVAPGRIHVVTKIDAQQPDLLRLVADAAGAPSSTPAHPPAPRPDQRDAQPVGESHFESKSPMNVARGASAMVSMVRSPTEGEVVYLYDAESDRGNANFAFRAVRFKNPTDSTLETGPVTVYGHERFIGEGLTEPIPPRASAVVPFALDRQIVVERHASEDDQLSRLMTLQRGILTADVQHTRRQQLTITNRLPQPARVFIRHTVGKAWAITDAPPAFERIGDAHLFEVQLAANEVKQVTIAEATPMQRSLDLGADPTLEMMRTWIDAPEGTPELKDQLRKLLALHKSLVDLGQAQDSMRRRLADYRGRMDELHGQIVTLQAVKTGGELMGHLRSKMKDISDRVQKTTIEIVDQEEKIMLARVRFQDAMSELSLADALAVNTPAAASSSARPVLTPAGMRGGTPGVVPAAAKAGANARKPGK